MNMYMTQGTTDYLEQIKISTGSENMHLFTNDFTGLLIHETTGVPFFKEPTKYEVIISEGELNQGCFLVLNYIPVTDEGRPIFEYHYKNKDHPLLEIDGLKACRVLRPLQNNTYVLLTLWESELAYKQWKSTHSYPHENEHPDKPAYPQPPYVKTYTTYEDNEGIN
jgi:heme oxygenase (mycobilin-producing)